MFFIDNMLFNVSIGLGEMRTKAVLKRCFNLLLNEIRSLPVGAKLGSEPELSKILRVSRTTVRSALVEAEGRGLIKIFGRQRLTLRAPETSDYFADSETESVSDAVAHRFLSHVSRGGFQPGDTINGLGLARELGISVAALRDYLNRFERFGLVERKPNTSWTFRGFTEDFALELSEIRELFELHAVESFLGTMNAARSRVLDDMERRHLHLLARIETDFLEFSELDATFHRELASAAKNRFMDQIQELISLVFHYHYLWNKVGERDRNHAATLEHLEIIRALKAEDKNAALNACRNHMKSAKTTLLRSIKVNQVPRSFHTLKMT